MKKSHSIALVLLASVSAVAALQYIVSGMGKAETVVSSLDDCTASYDVALCKAKFAEAQKTHESTAPQFPTRTACEQTYGTNQCTTATPSAGGSSIFIPAMVGFLAGQALGNPRPFYYGPGSAQNCGPGTNINCGTGGSSGGGGGRAIFSGRSYVGTYSHSSVGGATVTKASGGTVGSRAGAVARGGFGGSASAHGGGGGE